MEYKELTNMLSELFQMGLQCRDHADELLKKIQNVKATALDKEVKRLEEEKVKTNA